MESLKDLIFGEAEETGPAMPETTEEGQPQMEKTYSIEERWDRQEHQLQKIYEKLSAIATATTILAILAVLGVIGALLL